MTATVAQQPDAAPPHAAGVFARRLDGVIGSAVEAVAGSLVLVEIFVLLAGVIARYVFQKPLVRSDEVASMLFRVLKFIPREATS